MARKTSTIEMDSAKFLGAINSGAQAKVKFLDSKIREIGRAANANWRLTSLVDDKQLYIEDIDSRQYYLAEYARKKGGRYVIENIRKIKIVESKKREVFEKNCLQLVEAIEDNNQKAMTEAFSRMESQHFVGNTIPRDGVVRTKDNVTRFINIKRDTILGEDIRKRLTSAFADALSNKVTISDGVIVAGEFSEGKVKLPITEWTCRKVAARNMKSVAENAYWAPTFQDTVRKVAKNISSDNIAEAVNIVKPFVKEYQEFTLLSRNEVGTLIENALAATGCFNNKLAQNTATLFFRTNLKVNRDDIISEWRKTAQRASNSALLENVQILEDSNDFNAAYSKFIDLIFQENMSSRDVQLDAYLTTLKSLRNTLDTPDLKEKVGDLIESLEGNEVDDATIAEVEDLLAGTKEELTARDRLSDFDAMPGDMGDDDLEDDLATDLGAGKPFHIEINAPLISVNGDDTGMGGDLGGEDLGGEEDFDLGGDEEEEVEDELDLGDEDLGGDEEEDLDIDLEGATKGPAIMEGILTEVSIRDLKNIYDKLPVKVQETVDRHLLKIKELPVKQMQQALSKLGAQMMSVAKKQHGDSFAESKECQACGKTDCTCCQQCGKSNCTCEYFDPYAKPLKEGDVPEAFKDNQFTSKDGDDSADSSDSDSNDSEEKESKKPWEESFGLNYGEAPVIEGYDEVVTHLLSMAEEKKFIDLTEGSVNEQSIESSMPEMTKVALEAAGIKIPDHKMTAVVEHLFEMFKNRLQSVMEDQYKWGTKRRRRNPRRSSLAKVESQQKNKKPLTEGDEYDLVWVEHQDGAVNGHYRGVEFTVDSTEPPTVFNEDGSIAIDVTRDIAESALASAGLREGDDSAIFEWLENNVDKLIGETTPDEDNALEEAMVKIAMGQDGEMSVEVTGDVAIDEVPVDPAIDGGEPGMGEPGMPGPEPMDVGPESPVGGEPEMGPVNDPPVPPPASDEGEESVPDFEGGDDTDSDGPPSPDSDSDDSDSDSDDSDDD